MATDLKIQATISARENLSKTLTSLATRSRVLGGRIQTALAGAGRGIANAFGRAARSATMFGAAAGAAAGAALVAATKSYVDQADALGELATRTGLSVEALQEWSYVAERAGVSSDEWERNIVKLGSNMGKLRAGGGSLVTLLKKVAPSMIPALEATGSTEEAMRLLFDATRSLQDPTQRQVLLESAFGKGASKTALIAAMESAEIERLREEKRRYGVISTEAADKAGKLDDAQIRLKASLGGLRSAIAERLVPTITPWVDRLADWIAKNRELIGSRVEATIGRIADAIARIDWSEVAASLERVWGRVTDITSAIGGAVDAIGGWGTAIVGLFGIKIAGALAGTLKSIREITSAIAGTGAATAAGGATAAGAATAGGAGAAGAGAAAGSNLGLAARFGIAGLLASSVAQQNAKELRAAGDETGARGLEARSLGGGNRFDAFSRGGGTVQPLREVVIRLSDDAKKLLKTSDNSGTRRVGQ